MKVRFDISVIKELIDWLIEFNVVSKAECDQLNLAHETKNK